VVDLVWMVFRDLGAKRFLDLVGRSRLRDLEQFVVRLHLLLELRNIGGWQLATAVTRFAIAQPLRRSLRLDCALGAIGTEIPSRLQRAAAVRAAASEPLAAVRARVEIDADRGAALTAQRPHLAHFGDDAQELFGRGDAALHLRQAVLAERDHAA